MAYSGGVDSAVVAQAAQLACGVDALAVTAVSASLASGELENAIAIARQIGIRHEVNRNALICTEIAAICCCAATICEKLREL